MPANAVNLCKPCLNRKYPLRKQLLLSFLSLAAVSLLLALAVVMGTTEIIGNKARTSAENSLEEQIMRHLKNKSTEAAATIGEKFRRLQYGVLNVTSYGLRDALQEVSLSVIHGGAYESFALFLQTLGNFPPFNNNQTAVLLILLSAVLQDEQQEEQQTKKFRGHLYRS
ncbi:unnamed protein product [Laminaria digitata]